MKQKLSHLKSMVWAVLCSHTGIAHSDTRNSCSSELLPLLENETLNLVDRSFKFLEGPTWSKESQHFYFSEMDFESPQTSGPYSTIYRLKLPDTIEVFSENSGSNGLLASESKLLIMDHAHRALSELSELSKKKQIILSHFQWKKFNSPNDLVLSKAGHLYFTDPNWQLGDRTQELSFTGIFQLAPSGEVILVDKDLIKPNGVTLSPDEKWLYVGDYSHQIFRYPIDNNGNAGSRELFTKIDTPDGLAMDCAGNLYAAAHVAGEVIIVQPNGAILGSIEIGHKVTNIAFGGAELKTLLITTDHALYTLKVNIPGAR